MSICVPMSFKMTFQFVLSSQLFLSTLHTVRLQRAILPFHPMIHSRTFSLFSFQSISPQDKVEQLLLRLVPLTTHCFQLAPISPLQHKQPGATGETKGSRLKSLEQRLNVSLAKASPSECQGIEAAAASAGTLSGVLLFLMWRGSVIFHRLLISLKYFSASFCPSCPGLCSSKGIYV